MVTKAAKKVVKKATKVAPTTNKNTVTLTLKQALQMQAFMTKKNKSFKVFDTKITNALKA